MANMDILHNVLKILPEKYLNILENNRLMSQEKIQIYRWRRRLIEIGEFAHERTSKIRALDTRAATKSANAESRTNLLLAGMASLTADLGERLFLPGYLPLEPDVRSVEVSRGLRVSNPWFDQQMGGGRETSLSLLEVDVIIPKAKALGMSYEQIFNDDHIIDAEAKD